MSVFKIRNTDIIQTILSIKTKGGGIMKKLFTIFLALVLVYAFAVPAYALENIFGGYWRTRMFTQSDFSGTDAGTANGAQDLTRVDTRTRLYYTAKFSDNFKFVNKFEMNAVWGNDTGGGGAGNTNKGYGNIGADSVNIRVKNTYADMTFAPVNLKIGAQGVTLNRGFLFDDDASGVVATFNVDKNIAIPVFWVKAYEGGMGKGANDYDTDYFGIYPSINAGAATLKPIFMYAYSKNAARFGVDQFGNYPSNALSGTIPQKLGVYYLGVDVDATAGPASVWFTGIYEGGKTDLGAPTDTTGTGPTTSVDVKAYLLAAGASADVQAINLHGQIFYASGGKASDTDMKTFWVPAGQSYYWSEIMGYGIFDNQVSAGSPADQIGNIMAANLGVTVKPMPKLSLTGDLWFAQLAQDNALGNKDLGTEFDLIGSYALLDNLNLDVVAAYLAAGKATTGGSNEKNPMEIGAQLSLSF
jgi:hypothetical protein